MRLNFLQYSCSFLILLFSCNAASWAQNDDASKKSLHFADSVYQLKEYENARSAYEYAARFQPNNTHIQNRLTEINKILAHEATKEADYKTAVSEAKKAFYINDLKKAEEELRKAVSIKSDPSSWAFQKLKEIETLAASQAQLQKDFQTQMTNGNNFLTAKNYEAAEKSFTAALNLIPNDAAATQKLSETQQKIKDRNTDYQKYITEGDRLYQADQILDAKVEYQKALALKPNETYPQQRIEHILSMQAEEADLENRVKNVVQEADQLFTAKNYEAAYTKYQAAIDVYPGHQHSKERLQEIDGILGEARAQQRAYDQAIAEADQLLSQQRLQEAKAKYETAKIAKPTESYPQQKITDIDKIIAQQLIDADKFSQLVSQGDDYYEKLQFESAKNAYEQALQLRPKDVDVQTKLTNTQSQIAKIDRQYNTLIAQADNQFKIGKIIDAQVVYEEASALKPNEKYPKDQINAIQQRLSTQQEMLEKSYIDAITAGDNFLRNNDFVNAKAEYTKASSIKPKE
ncbi:MAG: hypothetical protein PHR53_06820, partial [Bacteroidales bacterium]|nr:hypothetical protein [Bacteroidales bacterium]